MELHSYAKLRGYRKWTIEQKRKLVEARINYDGIFSRKSSNCMDSWKKIMAAAKLNDFNVCFVRKQWANLLARYKAYKRTRLRHIGKNGDITEQVIREISEEWEFFYPIHSFMSRKITNFHSYAQSPRPIANNSPSRGNGDTASATTNDTKSIPPNTDHDFYSKSACQEAIDIRMDSIESSPQVSAASNSIIQPKSTEEVQTNTIPESKKKKRKKKRKPSERDKYYKHRRRYNRRNERRFDALLNVFGQMIKSHYPNVNTSKLQAQCDLVSTEDEDMSTVSMSSTASTSTYTASSEESDP